MWFDRLWYALWVPLAFVQTLIVVKWAIWGFDVVTVVLTIAFVFLLVLRVITWQNRSAPF